MESLGKNNVNLSEIPAAANDNRPPEGEVMPVQAEAGVESVEQLNAETAPAESELHVGDPASEIASLESHVNNKLTALNEHRAQMGLPPLEGHEVPALHEEVQQLAQLQEAPAEETPQAASPNPHGTTHLHGYSVISSLGQTHSQMSARPNMWTRAEQQNEGRTAKAEIHGGVIEVPIKKVPMYIDLFTRNGIMYTIHGGESQSSVRIEVHIPGTIELRSFADSPFTDGNGGRREDFDMLIQELGTQESVQEAALEQQAQAVQEQPAELAPEVPASPEAAPLEAPAEQPLNQPAQPSQIPLAANDNRPAPPTAANNNRPQGGQIAV